MTSLPLAKLASWLRRLTCDHKDSKATLDGQAVGKLHLRVKCPSCGHALIVRDVRDIKRK